MRKRSNGYDEEEKAEEWEEMDGLGPEPDKDNAQEYLAWLQRAVDLSYPEEAMAANAAAVVVR
jgi:hypothetical protein